MPVVYTAMHGVGCSFVQRAFDAFGHGRSALHLVAAQCEPDPTFPTVAFPNPEGKGALKLAFEEAERQKATLVLANDPEIAWPWPSGRSSRHRGMSRATNWERCWDIGPGIAGSGIPQQIRRKFPRFVWWDRLFLRSFWHALLRKKDSDLCSSIASELFGCVETLTGFKWMGSKSADLRAEGFEMIFAYEEAIGFCCGDIVKDKDGIAAASVFVEMAKAWSLEGHHRSRALQCPRRIKLQQELAQHRGSFFNAIFSAMARRMQPARVAEAAPAELAMRGVTATQYVERYGGYGRCRDIGNIMWQVAMALGHLQNDNVGAAKDSIALLAVCLEQTSLDSGRMDVGLLIPDGAFAPLADQKWIANALSYIKEPDTISTKRNDVTGRPGQKDSRSEASGEPSSKKAAKRGARPWKKKNQGQEEEEA
eukprot:s1005_g13.t1